ETHGGRIIDVKRPPRDAATALRKFKPLLLPDETRLANSTRRHGRLVGKESADQLFLSHLEGKHNDRDVRSCSGQSNLGSQGGLASSRERPYHPQFPGSNPGCCLVEIAESSW